MMRRKQRLSWSEGNIKDMSCFMRDEIVKKNPEGTVRTMPQLCSTDSVMENYLRNICFHIDIEENQGRNYVSNKRNEGAQVEQNPASFFHVLHCPLSTYLLPYPTSSLCKVNEKCML